MPKITQSTADERSPLTFTAVEDGPGVPELLRATQELSLVRSEPEILEILRRTARRLVGADAATIALREPDACFYAEEDSVTPLWRGERLPLDASVSGWTMCHGEAAIIPDLSADDRVPAAYRATFVRSLAVMPIRARDPLGAIGVYWAQPHQASAHEVRLLQGLAESAAVAFQNAGVYTGLEATRAETLRRLALAAEYRDDETFHHTERVAHVATHIAGKLGLDATFQALIRQAAPLHDVGKLAISDAILLKPDVLTATEILHVRAHAVSGAEILAGSHSDVLQMAEEIALTHHEWWDGSGYPNRLSYDQIPISGRIVALADVFDVLIHERPYKQPWTLDEALREIDHLSGRQFDPMVVTAFFQLDEADLVVDPEEILALTPGIRAVAESRQLVSSPAA
ncbi:MAG TPA: HD domain-containing phosphohydrolase [Solirubrobacteraceae bacterium]|nr:HD domain-containing phosphohydrolase [Solirubrobacteraceae bacterium]